MSQTQRSALRAIVDATTGRGKRGLLAEKATFRSTTFRALANRGLATVRYQLVRGGNVIAYFVPTQEGRQAVA